MDNTTLNTHEVILDLDDFDNCDRFLDHVSDLFFKSKPTINPDEDPKSNLSVFSIHKNHYDRGYKILFRFDATNIDDLTDLLKTLDAIYSLGKDDDEFAQDFIDNEWGFSHKKKSHTLTIELKKLEPSEYPDFFNGWDPSSL